MLKSIFLFILSVVIGVGLIISYVTVATAQSTPQVTTTTPIPSIASTTTTNGFSLQEAPPAALRGTINSMSGGVSWQSRIATQSSAFTDPSQKLQQGEILQTDATGSATMQFPNCCSIALSVNTTISFVQTLPVNVVIAQSSGIAEYTVTNNVPLAVRSSALLINIPSGDVVFSVSKTSPLISVYVKKGEMQASYNDLNYDSTVIPVTEGQTFIFNTTTRNEDIE